MADFHYNIFWQLFRNIFPQEYDGCIPRQEISIINMTNLTNSMQKMKTNIHNLLNKLSPTASLKQCS